MVHKKNIVWFEEVDKHDIGLVGGKGANLGEMTNANLPIPYGFIVTSNAYFEFIHHNKLETKIKNTLSIVNFDNPGELQQAGSHIRKLILDSEISHQLSEQVTNFYRHLQEKEDKFYKKRGIKLFFHPALVAVRSSATAEDLPTASFAGQQETYLNVRGETSLLSKIKDCWASLFTNRAIFYRHQNGFDNFKVGLAAVIQRMVQSEKSGIAFSIDPVSNDKTKIIIEAIFGLGEYIVGGKVTPDHYEVDKKSLVILKNEIKKQAVKLVKSGISNKEVKLGSSEGNKQKINEEEILQIALLVKEIENHYYFPQDIEWAIEKDKIYIVQSRPITTIKSVKLTDSTDLTDNRLPVLIGSPASPGIGVGPVNIIFSPKEIHKIKKGDVLVAPQTNPDYVPAMKKAGAIVTEKGGRTSHAAIVSREMGIPAVVGAERATKILKNEMIVSVNGATGEIFKGKIISSSHLSNKTNQTNSSHLKTTTKVYVNLAEPEQAKKISEMNVDGIGLLRAEFMIAQIGTHPKEFIRKKQTNIFINRLTKDLLTFVKAFHPRPVVYRATDFKTNEYRNLKGGKLYEPVEDNPMLGFRGAYRYIANPDVFDMELQAIKKVREAGYNNLQLMIPFIRVPWELIKIKQIIQKFGLFSYSNFKLWIMVEVPACALNLEEFIKIGIDGVSIGTNDLTMMVLGIDRDSEEVADIYDERHPIIVNLLKNIVTTCKKNQITSSICGQAVSDYPDLVEELVKTGITSVSVNPDVLNKTREIIYNIEKKL